MSEMMVYVYAYTAAAIYFCKHDFFALLNDLFFKYEMKGTGACWCSENNGKLVIVV